MEQFVLSTNLALAHNPPEFQISTPDAPTYSRMRFLPASRFDNAKISQSFIADGCQIGDGAVIENSIIGIRSKIGKNCVIRNSIIMGQDFISKPDEDRAEIAAGRPVVGIGDNVIIDGAIVDKNVQIGHDVIITNPSQVQNTDEREFGMIRDGVICVEKAAVLRPYWSLAESLSK